MQAIRLQRIAQMLSNYYTLACSTKASTKSLFVPALSQSAKQHEDRFRALGNLGEVLLKMSSTDEALKAFAKQLILSKQLKNKKLEAVAFGSLGVGHRIAKQFDKSLGFHTQVFPFLVLTQNSKLFVSP